jgi:polar amino acid transport system substrate-binding protein
MLLVCLAHPAFSQDCMTFVYFENFAPYSWSVDNRMQGILIDIVNEAVQKELGIPVCHAGYPWKRAQKMVEAGQADAFISTPTDKRMAYTIISKEPVTAHLMTLFTHKGNRKVRNLQTVGSISDLNLFTSVNYIGNGWAEKNLKSLDVHWTPTMDRALFLLANSRYDIYVGSATNVRFNLKRLGYRQQIVETPIVLDVITHNLCIGKQSAFVAILPAFDDVIRKWRTTGRLQEIVAKYE